MHSISTYDRFAPREPKSGSIRCSLDLIICALAETYNGLTLSPCLSVVRSCLRQRPSTSFAGPPPRSGEELSRRFYDGNEFGGGEARAADQGAVDVGGVEQAGGVFCGYRAAV